jgi:hypothetical protein
MEQVLKLGPELGLLRAALTHVVLLRQKQRALDVMDFHA